MEMEKSIKGLKEQLSVTSKEKERYFQEKEELRRQILSIIKDVKQIKSEKDKSNVGVKEIKQNRDNYNQKVKELIVKVKIINEKKRELSRKHNLKEDPSKIKTQINELELKIETEVLTLSQEKRVMKQIKDLKKKYSKLGEVTHVIDEYSKISKEIEENRVKAEGFHKQLKELTKDSDYSMFKEKSKEIDELKKKQEGVFHKFVEAKAKVSLLTTQIKSKEEKETKIKESKKKRKEEFLDKKVKEAEERVEEKLKAKKKLTTDDLLMLQK